MRKNLLANVTSPDPPAVEVSARSDYARRGASRSMMMSIDEMAENAKKVIAGETIVSLDPHLVDPSFVRDRIDEEDADFAVFRQGISERGQLQPILVRPHPDLPGRFMIVFGHRRARAARELGLPVRAVVKEIEEINHIIAQGRGEFPSGRPDLHRAIPPGEKAHGDEPVQGYDQSCADDRRYDTVAHALGCRNHTVGAYRGDRVGQRSWSGSLGGAEEDRHPSKKGRFGAANCVQRRISPARGCRAFRFRACACG